MKTPEEIKKGLECCGNSGKCKGCPYYGGYELCMGTLAEDALAYVQQLEDHIRDHTKMVPRWISVKDRLPEYAQDVLLIAHGWEGQLLYIGCLHHEEARKSWLTGITSKESEWSISGWSYLRAPEVTHWMPLPEPPEAENADE